MLDKIFDVTLQISLICVLGMGGFIFASVAMYIATVGIEEAFSKTNKPCIIVEAKKE